MYNSCNIVTLLHLYCYIVPYVIYKLNKNTLGMKLTRSNPTYVQPKALISAEAKKSPIKDVLNYFE